MGSLRTLFAIAVVFAHSYGYVFVGGRNAVQLFYMISGFLMSYIIVERKAYSCIKDFYASRFLRLYPIYIVVAALTLIWFLISEYIAHNDIEFFRIYRDAPISANALLVLSNISLFLQDWVMFAGVEHDRLVFSRNFAISDVVLYKGLLVPQAWSLGVELSFYVIAPFILPRRRVFVALLLASIALRLYLVYIGLGKDPWSYRFFPTELALFLLGAVSHQVILPYYRRVLSDERIHRASVVSTYFLVFFTIAFPLIPTNEPIKRTVLFAIFLALMPLAFLFQSDRRWDKWIGDLSYPIYICHLLVIYIVGFLLGKLGVVSTITTGVVAVFFSVCLSIVLNIYIGSPVESLRNKLRTKI